MKNKKEVIQGFKAVKFMREVRDKMSEEIKDMSIEEILQYFEEKRKLNLAGK